MIDKLIKELDWEKTNGLIPCIVQDNITNSVLMMAFVSKESLAETANSNLLTFYSRSRQKLWTKGEDSKNTLEVVDIKMDCDKDTLLARVKPKGPVCHKGTDTCWAETNESISQFYRLEQTINSRKNDPLESSYTSSLFAKGINKVAQKVGEEAIEMVIEAKDENDELFLNEAADLMYHYIVLLAAKGFTLNDIEKVLKKREK
jgi:phosphoribosyl-ATP pyrophosphohydrolase/phosphoribosyl-AMP cyclohydrolase